MADIIFKYGTATSLTVTGLSTLANGSSATSDTVSNTTNLFLDVLIEVLVTTAAGATATGVVEIYAKGSIDGTDFDDDSNDKWIGTISLPSAGAGSRKRVVTLASAFGGSVPASWQIRIKNSSGAALTAGSVQYLGITAQSV